jgi:hypothetical protein
MQLLESVVRDQIRSVAQGIDPTALFSDPERRFSR